MAKCVFCEDREALPNSRACSRKCDNRWKHYGKSNRELVEMDPMRYVIVGSEARCIECSEPYTAARVNSVRCPTCARVRSSHRHKYVTDRREKSDRLISEVAYRTLPPRQAAHLTPEQFIKNFDKMAEWCGL